MFRNYLKLGWRNLAKNSTYSIIIISGLVLAYSACLAIFLFVENETSYDRQSPDAERIYRVVKNFVNDDGTTVPDATTPSALAPHLLEDISQLESVVRIWPTWSQKMLMSSGSKEFFESRVFLADSNVIDFFNLKVIKGDAQKALSDPKNIVLTESTAKRYFGTEDPIGKMIGVDSTGQNQKVVSAVIADLPPNMHFHFDMVVALWIPDNPEERWDLYMYYTYIKLKPGVDISEVDPQVVDSFNRHRPGRQHQYYTQPLTDIHLTSKLKWELEPAGDQAFVTIFITIGIFIFLIASVNYINLSIVQALNRAKEVGIRKVSGALSHELIKQFLLESITISISAFVIAVLVVQGIRPLINNAFGQNLPSLFDLPSWYLVIIFTIVLFASGLSGLYPSLYLAAFKPVKVLKGMFQPGDRTLWLRKGLIVFQFSISIALIAGAAIVFKQVDYIQSKHLGFDKEQVIVIENLANRSKQNVRSLKETIRQINGVSGIASSFAVLGGTHAATDFVSRDSKIRTQINFAGVDENYVRLLGFEFVAGRDFNGTDKILPNGANKVILNETAVNDLGIGDDPIGALIAIEGNDSVYHEVIGVVKDFNFATLRTEIKPYAFMLEENFVTNFVVKTATSDYDQLLKDLEHAWSNSGIPGPFHYFFLDEQIDALYRAEQNFELIFLIFTAISVYIACSGLFAVASYFIKRRTKEIGIRKALGASVSQVTWLVSAGFLRMVIIANLLAWPATWMFMSDWLNGFAYHIDMTWVIFAVSGALALAIAIFTIGGQSVRAAQANPIQSLRNE